MNIIITILYIQSFHLHSEIDDLKKKTDEAERRRKLLELEVLDSGEVLEDLKKTNEQLMSVKIKLETDLDLLNVRYLCLF